MKKFLDRFIAGSLHKGLPAAHGADDAGFYSTVFLDRPGFEASRSGWTSRARIIGAETTDRERGLSLLSRAWAADRFMTVLGADERARLGHYLDFVFVPPGRELIAQDEQGDYALVVLDGVVAVDRIQPWGARVRLAEAREGDVLGEMALLDAGHRVSSCTSLSRCILAVLLPQRLDELMLIEPRLAAALLASIGKRLSLRLRHVSARLGAALSAD
jgi:CRP-like cAMP-binding protein